MQRLLCSPEGILNFYALRMTGQIPVGKATFSFCRNPFDIHPKVHNCLRLGSASCQSTTRESCVSSEWRQSSKHTPSYLLRDLLAKGSRCVPSEEPFMLTLELILYLLRAAPAYLIRRSTRQRGEERKCDRNLSRTENLQPPVQARKTWTARIRWQR